MEAGSSHDDIRAKFASLNNAEDVAELLGVSYKALRYRLYGEPEPARYHSFEIPKKSGGLRRITAPNKHRKLLQRRLLRVLEYVYEPKAVVHGFTADRGIRTNALPHVRRRYVLNVDLADYFPTINFGRVRGMFMAAPYSCPEKVATVLAQICCFKNELPQGAPTSPIVSNMICARMDSHLGRLAREYRCAYTRYADDLTFSTDRQRFPDDLAEIKVVGGKTTCVVGRRLRRVIQKNGFSVNAEKVRLQSPHQRQEVTGLVTNRRANVNRRFVRDVRALLHKWRKEGLEACQRLYEDKYLHRRHRAPGAPVPPFVWLVKGKIEFLGMIRGKDDQIYRKFMKQLAGLAPDLVDVSFLRDDADKLLEPLWVVWVDFDDGSVTQQGTGFFLDGVGFVTCSHVLGKSRGIKIRVESGDGKARHEAKVIFRDATLDLAILDVGFESPAGLSTSESEIKRQSQVVLLGFPNHNVGDEGAIYDGKVTSFRNDPLSGERLFLIDAPIIYGNSGGPVLDSSGKVVGMAVRGAASQKGAQETEFNAVLPIALIERAAGHTAGVEG